ncbi:hypothetical protein PENTCL1PPCAC_29808, partial [Pristionchus entomophagus]
MKGVRSNVVAKIIIFCVCMTMMFLVKRSVQNEHHVELSWPYQIFTAPRSNRSIEVAIVVILTQGSDLTNYQTALNSVECYAALHGYYLRVESDDKFEECSRHEDKFFRRHCHTRQMMMKEIPENAYVLFIDADVGIVNPNK